MNRNQPEIVEPGRALTFLLFAVAFGAFWWWLAQAPGWEIAWLGVAASALVVLTTWRQLVASHRADKERKRIERLTQEISETYTTGGRWQQPAPRGRQDRGWPSR